MGSAYARKQTCPEEEKTAGKNSHIGRSAVCFGEIGA
jgi:hypothetical protein